MVISLFGSGSFGRFLGVAPIESVHATSRIYQFLLAGKERVAIGADFQVKLWLGRARFPRCAARAARFDVEVFRVDSFLHCRLRWV